MSAPSPIRYANAPRLTRARAFVFLASFCLMVVEIVAGRMTAPYLGVSLYTWTSVIGAILLGVTVGNYAGGRIADRVQSQSVFGVSFCLAGVAALLAGYLARWSGPFLSASSLPLWASTSAFAFTVFFPAAFFLSTISPQAVKFDLHDLEKTGATIGTIGAWSAAGSIVGTFATGFILIAYVGTQNIMHAVAAVLIAAGCFLAAGSRLWKKPAAAIVVIAFAGGLSMPSLCQMETDYYCIRVQERTGNDGFKHQTLFLDHLIHSVVTPARADEFGYEYEQIQAGLVAERYTPDDAFSTLTIGGGGYSMPRYFEQFYPKAVVDVVEIDPGVTEANHRFLALSRDSRIHTEHMDARLFLAHLPQEKTYDMIFGDAVNDFAVPYQITTREFYELVRAHLSIGGSYATTVIDDPQHARFTAALLRTLQSVFPQVTLFPMGSDLDQGRGRNTFEILAAREPFDAERWRSVRPRQSDAFPPLSQETWDRLMRPADPADLARFLSRHPTPMLTDDFAPTDHYLAPVFMDAYRKS